MIFRYLPLSILALLALALSGCIPPQYGAASPSLRQELASLKTSQQSLAEQVEQTRASLALIEARVQDQQFLIQELRQELVAKKGTLRREIAPRSAPSSQQGTPSSRSGEERSPTEIYLKAFSDYASGRFEPAIEGFETFLRLYPGNNYASNAQYWLGECFYGQKDYARAYNAFQKMADTYPRGTKTPEALLKMSTTATRLNQPERAEQALQVLRSRYPDSAAAKKSLRR